MLDKIVRIQQELKVPKSQRNTFGNYNYRSCEDIIEHAKPLCHREGLVLSLSDEVIAVADRVYIKATATLSDGDKEFQCIGMAREALTQKGMNDSQITGATSSYARKYALNGLFAIDDTKDADATNDHKEPQMTVEKAIENLRQAKSAEELKTVFLALPQAVRNNSKVVAKKDELKAALNK